MSYLLALLLPAFVGVALTFFVLIVGGLFADLVAGLFSWTPKLSLSSLTGSSPSCFSG